MMLENAGIPAIPVVTDAFGAAASEMTKLWGEPDFRFVMMRHPLFTLTAEGIQQRADELLDGIMRLLRSGQPDNGLSGGSRAVDGAASQDSEPGYVDVDPAHALDFCYEQGWTDGLPVVPATQDLVNETLEAARLRPNALIADVSARNARITARKVAANAVMAGCKPEYMPVVVAAVKALAVPEFGLHHVCSGHSGATTVVVVNGPIARKLNINATHNVFGQGWRANATIGRALRLVMVNCLNYRPGQADSATMGTPGKFTCCIAENEENHPWEPWHVEKGFRAEDSTVTLVAASTMIQIRNDGNHEQLLHCIGDALSFLGSIAVRGKTPGAVVLCGRHAETLRFSGWSKKQIRDYVVAHTGRSVAELKRAGWIKGDITDADEQTLNYAMDTPEDLMLICAGGPAGGLSMVLPGFGAEKAVGRSRPILIEEAH